MGSTTVSNSSLRITSMEHGFWHNGVGLGVGLATGWSAVPDALFFPEADSVRVIACEQTISRDATMPAAINKTAQSRFFDRLSMNVLNSFHVSRVRIPSVFTNRPDRLSIQVQYMLHSCRATRVKRVCARPR
jgi:hypothetical protein